jgi:sporulation protein YlmC with PRC-barrel domain
MTQINLKNFIGTKVIGQHGREVGTVADVHVDCSTWRVDALEVQLRREILDELHLKRPFFGTQIVRVPIDEVSGAADVLVLKKPLETFDFTGTVATDAPTESEHGPSGLDRL